MRFEKTGKWSIGDDDCFYGEFSTKEEALKEAKTLELDSIGQVYNIHYTEGDFIFKFDEMFDSVDEHDLLRNCFLVKDIEQIIDES